MGALGAPHDREAVAFLVIGAQKCATTTLFRHLSAHPEIYLPPQKEVNFFARDHLYERGADWYRDHFFAEAPPDAIRGEASPLYLATPAAAERIRAVLPRIKLVAVLRNPIDRAYSHYRMAVRNEIESASFGDCIRTLATRGDRPAESPDAHRDYLLLGEYGRQLATYLRHFDRRQLHVTFTEDLARDPAAVMRRVTSFLGADAGFAYPELGRVYHAGGSARLARPFARAVKRSLRFLEPLLGHQRANALAFWFETEASVRREADSGPTEDDRAFLRDHYRKDVAQLRELLGVEPPWREFGAGA